MLKAILKIFYCLFLIVIFLCSCDENKKENLLTDKILGVNLILANDFIAKNTNTMIETFRNYSTNPAVSEKTNPMLENMILVNKITTGTIKYFEDLKREIKIEAGLKLVNLKEEYNEDNFTVVTNIFENKKKGSEVLNQLIKYQNSIQRINPDLFVSLKSPYYFFDHLSTPKEKLETEFTNSYFGNINTNSAVALLTKFENDVRLYENKAVRFFYTKVAIDLLVMEN